MSLLQHRVSCSWLERLLCHFLRHAGVCCSEIFSMESLGMAGEQYDMTMKKAGGKGRKGGDRDRVI